MIAGRLGRSKETNDDNIQYELISHPQSHKASKREEAVAVDMFAKTRGCEQTTRHFGPFESNAVAKVFLQAKEGS